VKRPENDLNVDHMNVHDGGRQPFMQDIMWNGQLQKVVIENGTHKGLKTALQERGVDTSGMNAWKRWKSGFNNFRQA